MKYQKEFEEYMQGKVPYWVTQDLKADGTYRSSSFRALYFGFVAGIESGIKKKEPTLLGLVGEWRKSNISDEGLLNNIKNQLNKPDNYGWVPKSFIKNIRELPNIEYIDLLMPDGSVMKRANTRGSGFLDRFKKSVWWRPSAIQD